MLRAQHASVGGGEFLEVRFEVAFALLKIALEQRNAARVCLLAQPAAELAFPFVAPVNFALVIGLSAKASCLA